MNHFYSKTLISKTLISKTLISKTLLSSVLVFATTLFAFAQQTIEGKWWDEEKKGQVEVYKSPNGKFYGKIIYLKEPIDAETGKPALDKNNKDASKRGRATMGLVTLLALTESKGVYEGQVYNPKDGNIYSGRVTLLPDGRLKLRGYVGVSFIGKTEVWERVK